MIFDFNEQNATVVTRIEYDVDSERNVIILGNTDDRNVTLSNTITQYPLVNGDQASDHSIKEPATITISGNYMRGKKSCYAFQQRFEILKSSAYLCTVKQYENTDTFINDYKVRKNLVLTGISWTEKINSLSYSLTFREIFFADVAETTVQDTSSDYPDLGVLQEHNYTEVLLNREQLANAIRGVINEIELEQASGLYISSGGALAGAGIAAIPLPGMRVVGGIVAISSCIINALNNVKDQDDKDELYNQIDILLNQPDCLSDVINDINDKVRVYSYTQTGAQSCSLYIGSNLYTVELCKVLNSESYSQKIYDIQPQLMGGVEDTSSLPEDISKKSAYICTLESKYIYFCKLDTDDENDMGLYIIVSDVPSNEIISEITEGIKEELGI